MSVTSHAEITKRVYERLIGTAELVAIFGQKIYNHVPQDTALPVLTFRWGQASDFDTKSTSGWDGFITMDIWTDYRGDKVAQEAVDLIDAAMHNVPFSMTSGQSLLLQHDFSDSFTEPDGKTHHTTLRFRAIFTS